MAEAEFNENEGQTPAIPARPWAGREATANEPIYVETGRGQSVAVQPGEPFIATVERIADEAHYGGYFRVFLNGEEILNPTEAPATFVAGQRVAVAPCTVMWWVNSPNSGKAEMLILSQA
jgi:hypothetical protein